MSNPQCRLTQATQRLGCVGQLPYRGGEAPTRHLHNFVGSYDLRCQGSRLPIDSMAPHGPVETITPPPACTTPRPGLLAGQLSKHHSASLPLQRLLRIPENSGRAYLPATRARMHLTLHDWFVQAGGGGGSRTRVREPLLATSSSISGAISRPLELTSSFSVPSAWPPNEPLSPGRASQHRQTCTGFHPWLDRRGLHP